MMISGIMTEERCSVRIINEVVDRQYRVGTTYNHGEKFMIDNVCYLVERVGK